MSAAGLSQAGVANSSSNFIGRKETASMLDGIMYNTRQAQAQERAAKKKNVNVETASISTFSSDKPLLKENKGSGSSVRNFFKRSSDARRPNGDVIR